MVRGIVANYASVEPSVGFYEPLGNRREEKTNGLGSRRVERRRTSRRWGKFLADQNFGYR